MSGICAQFEACNNPRMVSSRLIKCLSIIFLCSVAVQAGCAQPENEPLTQLRADYDALLKARAEFEEAEKTPDRNNEEQADYAAWIQQLSKQFSESCRVVSKHSPQSIPADIPCSDFTTAFISPAGIDTTYETTDAEKTGAMVDRFDDSLGEFDEKLLREQDRVKARKPLGTSSGSVGGGGMTGGQDGESAGESEWASTGDSPAEGQQGSDPSPPGTRGSSSHGAQSTAPADIPDGSDDDVIARQLREAAENEADPELKKKLWEEYRRYKKG